LSRAYRASNGRVIQRGSGGRFRRTTPADLGIGGVCPTCGHLLLQYYAGDSRERPLDPQKWGYRCFTCQPLTEAEQRLQEDIATAGKPTGGFTAMLEAAAAKLSQEQ